MEGELSDDEDATITDPDQALSEEQTYRETMRRIRSFMGWTHIPDIDSSADKLDNNPFAGPKKTELDINGRLPFSQLGGRGSPVRSICKAGQITGKIVQVSSWNTDSCKLNSIISAQSQDCQKGRNRLKPSPVVSYLTGKST